MRGRLSVVAVAAVMVWASAGCEARGDRELSLPDPDSVASWFGPGTEARLSGNVLEIRGRIDPEYLRRGGSLWAEASPYFYLFNVQIERVVREHEDLAAVRAITLDSSGREVARATLLTGELNEYEWRTALALASRAQREGTESPRHLASLVRFGEDHTEYEYSR